MTLKFMILVPLQSAALAGAALLAAVSLPAHSATLTDTYYGGTNTYNGSDVIGSSAFNITSADVTRSGPGNNTLNVVIHTNYAGVPGTPAAEQTGYGSLFFASTPFTPNGTATSFPEDVYTANRWNYAFTMPQNPGLATTGNSALYAIGGNASPHPFNASGIPDFYTTDNGKIYMSNVHNNPITAPQGGNPGFYFRQGQAVQYEPGNPDDPNKKDGTWTVDALADTITFAINDGHILGDSFTLAWAMTCANDVILGSVVLHAGEDFPTPLPAAVWLFGTVIAGGAGVGRWRKAKRARLPTA